MQLICLLILFVYAELQLISKVHVNLRSLTGSAYYITCSERGKLLFIGSRKKPQTTNRAPIKGQSVGFSFYIAFHTVTESVCVRDRRMEKPRKAFTDFVDKALAAANLLHRDELMFSYKGIPYPTTVCSPEAFKALESFEARSDDVILAGYPKSGEYILMFFS